MARHSPGRKGKNSLRADRANCDAVLKLRHLTTDEDSQSARTGRNFCHSIRNFLHEIFPALCNNLLKNSSKELKTPRQFAQYWETSVYYSVISPGQTQGASKFA